MKKIEIALPVEGATNGETRKVEVSAIVVEKSLLLDYHGSPVPLPAMLTSDGKLRILINSQFGYIDHDQFKQVKAANVGTMPLSIMSIERYYEAHENGLLEELWK